MRHFETELSSDRLTFVPRAGIILTYWGYRSNIHEVDIDKAKHSTSAADSCRTAVDSSGSFAGGLPGHNEQSDPNMSGVYWDWVRNGMSGAGVSS